MTRDEALAALAGAKEYHAAIIESLRAQISVLQTEIAKENARLANAKLAYFNWCSSAKEKKEIFPAVRRALRLGAISGLGWTRASNLLGIECRSNKTFDRLTAGYEALTILDLPEEIRPARKDFMPDQERVAEWLRNIAVTKGE